MTDTKGEKIIEFFLDDEGISFKKEEEIHGLKDDYREFRKADFFLPKYKVYIEFLGKWADQAVREEYNRKKDVYSQNRIPCIYIYPDNLGTLKYLFYMRLADELKKYPELKCQLFKYKLSGCSRILSIIWYNYLLLNLFILLLVNLSQANLIVTPVIALLLLITLLIAVGLTFYVILIFINRASKTNSTPLAAK